MITGRMLHGNFVYVFGVEGQALNGNDARFAKKRAKIVKEFESFARVKRTTGHVAYGAVYNFPTEAGARQWVASKRLPEVADMTISASAMCNAKIHRAGSPGRSGA